MALGVAVRTGVREPAGLGDAEPAGDGVATAEWLLLFLGAVIVADIALYWRIRLAHQIGEAVLRDLRDKLMKHLLTQPLSFFHARRHGSLISRMISDIEAMRNGGTCEACQ